MTKSTPIHGKVYSNNSTSVPLGSGGVFTGAEWINTERFGVIYVSVISDVASATDGLEIQQSSDGVNLDFDDVYTIPANIGKNFSVNPTSRFMRVVYTNGPLVQTEFRLQTTLKEHGRPSSHRIQDSISTDDDAELVKAVITGETPGGTFTNFQSTRLGNFRVAIDEYGDTSSIDAFTRLRVSMPHTLFDAKQLNDKQPLFFDESLGGVATSIHSVVNACTDMAVTASASDFVIRQTKQYFNYQPGKSTLSNFTFIADQDTGVTKRVGLFDGTGANNLTPNNGIFYEVTGSTISWNICKNGVTTETATQPNWNIDMLDGTGPSGITLDTSAQQIGLLDFQWLGTGRVRVGFELNGLIFYVHEFLHANNSTFTNVYMSTPNLPLRYDIQSDGSGGGDLKHICATVISEGGIEHTGILRSIDTGSTHLDADVIGTTYAVLGIRLKSTYLNITVVPEYFSLLSETNDDFRWSIHINPTVSGTFTYTGITDSAVESSTGVTANTVTAEGLKIDSGYSKAESVIDRRLVTSLKIGSTIAGVQDEIVLAVMPLSANADIQGSLTFRELL